MSEPGDFFYMGTPEQAETEFLKAARRYRDLIQPFVGTAAALRKRSNEEREARNRLADASLMVLWHKERFEP